MTLLFILSVFTQASIVNLPFTTTPDSFSPSIFTYFLILGTVVTLTYLWTPVSVSCKSLVIRCRYGPEYEHDQQQLQQQLQSQHAHPHPHAHSHAHPHPHALTGHESFARARPAQALALVRLAAASVRDTHMHTETQTFNAFKRGSAFVLPAQ